MSTQWGEISIESFSIDLLKVTVVAVETRHYQT